MENRPWFKHYDDGVPLSIDYPPVPLHHFLEESARKYPTSPCTIFKGAKITYGEMNDLTDRLAAELAEVGVKKGNRVSLFMPNTHQFVMAYFAILKIGGVVVATNPLYSAREIEYQLNDAGVETMLVMSNYYNLIRYPAQYETAENHRNEHQRSAAADIGVPLFPDQGKERRIFAFSLKQGIYGFRTSSIATRWVNDLRSRSAPMMLPSSNTVEAQPALRKERLPYTATWLPTPSRSATGWSMP